MSNLNEDLNRLRTIQDEITKSAVDGSLLLVDLVKSTPYKTRNGEEAWLSRLYDFYAAVRRAIAPLEPTKFLGDAVFLFARTSQVSPPEIAAIARRIQSEVDLMNKARRYTSDHIIAIRTVLGFGRVFLFEDSDPQGTPVDKLFRIEKYVPDGCIGLDTAFAEAAHISDSYPIGRYWLKGLADGRQEVHLLGPRTPKLDIAIDSTRRLAALHDIWDLGQTQSGKIVLISGYIPSESGQLTSIQMGDKEAVVEAFRNLAKVGRSSDVTLCTSRDVRDADLRENVVCIGGPCFNKVTLRFMREIRSPFIFEVDDDETPLLDCLTGNKYRAVWSGRRLLRDYGFFARFQNPLNPDAHVILACGIETHAVEGIVRAFSDHQSDFLRVYEALLEKASSAASADLPPFFAMMPFEVEDTGVVHLPHGAQQVEQLIFDWSTGHKGQLQSA